MIVTHYLLAVALACNQLGNAILGGDPGMTTSARAGYARAQGHHLGAGVCRVLEWLDPHLVNDKRPPATKIPGDHCQIAVTNFENSTP